MDTTNPTDSRLRGAVAEILNAHDSAGVMAHGAPDSEYDPRPLLVAAVLAAFCIPLV